MKRNYTKRQPTIWTTDKIIFLHKNYPKYGSKYCAEKLGLKIHQVSGKALLDKLKITSELRSKYQSEAAKKRLYTSSINANFLTNPQTKEACYILGFLWADGYLIDTERSRRVSSFVTGMEILETDWINVCSIFSQVGKWTISRLTKSYHDGIVEETRKIGIRITSNNKELFSFLKEHDYTTKSNAAPSKILDKIPEHLKHYWWRGYFDGDGCFYIDKEKYMFQTSFTGSFTQNWNEVTRLLDNLVLPWKFVSFEKTSSRGSCISMFKRDSMIKFGKFIYKDNYDNLGLKRKYDKFLLSLY